MTVALATRHDDLADLALATMPDDSTTTTTTEIDSEVRSLRCEVQRLDQRVADQGLEIDVLMSRVQHMASLLLRTLDCIAETRDGHDDGNYGDRSEQVQSGQDHQVSEGCTLTPVTAAGMGKRKGEGTGKSTFRVVSPPVRGKRKGKGKGTVVPPPVRGKGKYQRR